MHKTSGVWLAVATLATICHGVFRHAASAAGEIFIGGSNKAGVLRAVTDDYLRRCRIDITLDHGVDSMAMAMSLVGHWSHPRVGWR